MALTLAVVLIGLFLITPTVIVVVMSFSTGTTLHFPPPGLGVRWYQAFFRSGQWTDAASTSLEVAVLATLLATVLGTTTALGLVRGRFPFKGAVTAILLSPLIIPIVIVAVGMYMMYSRWGMTGSVAGMVAAHTCLGMPFVVVNVLASLAVLDRNLERAANSLGAGPIRTFFRITLPLILPGVLAGALFAFVTSWDEVVASLFLSSPFVRTLPVVMWSVVRSQIDPTIAAVAALLTAATIILFASVQTARRRGSKLS